MSPTYKEAIIKALNSPLGNYDGFDNIYFNTLCKAILKTRGAKPLVFNTYNEAYRFGLHIKYYIDVAPRLKDLPEILFFPEYDKILILDAGF